LHKIFIILFIIIQSNIILAQNSVLFKGVVKDSATNETLAGATLFIKSIDRGQITNSNGKFSMSVPKGEYVVQVSFIGYQPMVKNVSLPIDKTVVFKLKALSVKVNDVTVTAKHNDDNVKKNIAGIVEVKSKDIDLLPTLMGKPDIINVMRLTPGVQGGGEGNPGLYVRGGDAGQNLFLLDNMPLYNPSHLLGFFPVFNIDIIDGAKIYKSGIPAQYGGKTSSVIALKMKSGVEDSTHVNGSIGLLSSDITLKTPINKNRGSIIVSGRRTYLGLAKIISEPFMKNRNDFFDNSSYYFYDGSVKFRYNITSKTRIYLTAFGSKDVYNMLDEEYNISNTMMWSNKSGAVRLNHVFSDKLYMNISTGKTIYDFDIDAGFDQYNLNLYSKIDDWNSALDFTFLRKKQHPLKFGIVYTKHILTPNKIDVEVNSVGYHNDNKYYSNEFAAYINGDFDITKNLKLVAGVRQTLFQHIGPYTHYYRGVKGELTDSLVYEKNEIVKNYYTISPNISYIYVLNSKSSIKGSVSIKHQFIHLASVGSVSFPTDIWLPSTQFIEPQRVSQISSGYFRNFRQNMFETSVEVYYKYLENQIDFKNGVFDNIDNTKIEKNLLKGTGNAYGIEFFVKKQLGTTTGWISYTLSKTNRQFDDINNGKVFPAKYDRTHDLSITINHKLSKRWVLSAVFVYATGNAMTLPEGRYIVQNTLMNDYVEVNSFRMPAYHRLDVSATYKFKKRGRFDSSINFSIYNVYNRNNVYYIYAQVESDLANYYLSIKPKQISLFPILPSITWSFRF
jgi:hypothetical protein